MLEKITQLAEQAATSASRRQMLGRFGRAAAAAAAMLAGLLPSQAHAGKIKQCVNCYYVCPDGSSFSILHQGRGCPGKRDGCKFEYSENCGV
jgi:hypothetical protein